MATLKTNTLTGTSTAGSIAVTAEGNSTTTNLQQGLGKCWVNFNGTSFGERDSFNVASLTDNGSGDYTVNINNDMANANYAVTFAGGEKTVAWGLYIGRAGLGNATGSHRFGTTAPNDTLNDTVFACIAILGDLA